LSSLQDMQGIVLLIGRLKNEIQGLKARINVLETAPQVISYGGGKTRSFTGLTDTIANAQTPNTLLLDGSRAMTGDLTIGSHKIIADNAFLQGGIAGFVIRNIADTAYRDLTLRELTTIDNIQTDSIIERVPTAGVTIDGLLLKDSVLDGVDVLKFAEDFAIGIKATNDWVVIMDRAMVNYKSLICQTLKVRGDLDPWFNNQNDLGSNTLSWKRVFCQKVVFDSGDYISYDDANNRFLFTIGDDIKGYVDATGFHDGAP